MFLLYFAILLLFCCCLGTKLCPTLLPSHGLWPTRLLCPWDFPGKNTAVGCHFVLRGIFTDQGSNLRLLNWQMYSLPLSNQRSCCCSVASVVSDSVRPHRRQPTGLCRPWDSPGKNTGVGCRCLLHCEHEK